MVLILNAHGPAPEPSRTSCRVHAAPTGPSKVIKLPRGTSTREGHAGHVGTGMGGVGAAWRRVLAPRAALPRVRQIRAPSNASRASHAAS